MTHQLTKMELEQLRYAERNHGRNFITDLSGEPCKPILSQIPARVRFISYEPAIGPLYIGNYKSVPDWVICGGESGAGFRPMDQMWAARLRFECEHYEVPFFMKQMAGKASIPDGLMLRQFPVTA